MDNPALILGLVFLLLIFLSVPVTYAMVLAAATYLFFLSPGIPATVIPQKAIGIISESFTLLAIPLFLLAGSFMNASGMTARLVAFAIALVGHIRGGLGHAVIVSNLVMAGMSGSATADAAGIGKIMIPALKAAGFRAAAAAALNSSAATMGPIIPPSIAMVVYASLSGVSVGRLLLAGLVPGIIMALFLMIDLFFSKESAGVARQPFNWRRLFVTARDALLALILPAIILGGMVAGIYTPTEGAAVAVAYALVIGTVVYKTLTPALIYQSLTESARATGAVLLVVAAANAVSWILAAEGAGEMLKHLFLPFEASPGLTLLIIAGVVLLLGTAMEETTMLVLMTPVLVPVVAQAGIDPIHFGLVFVLATMIGLITPPVGITMFISCQIAGVSVNEFTRAVWRPFFALLAALVVVALWPDLVLFLPNLIMGQ